MTTLLLDLDPAIYRCGFAAERTEYHLVLEDADGNIIEKHFAPEPETTAGAAMQEWVAAHPDCVILDKERHVIPEPVDNAIRAFNFQIQHIINEVSNRYDDFSGVTVYLTDGTNYRDSIATVRPYKGNRDKLHRPVHYAALRDYARTEWNAVFTDGIEADDAISIAARVDDGHRHVVATIDKDLDQIPGVHFDYLKKVWYTVSHEDAEKFFWAQVLSGDITDNIPGCTGIGVAKAAKIIDTNWHLPKKELWNLIVTLYAKSQKLPKCEYKNRPAKDIALEMARLVKLQEYPNQLWNSPTT